ncbi:SusC/RagA family TonB-linked outer membrane protein [Aquiflexum lacus]|uniref:SusC/RagA family TonB-linked outer membrane protein n=1 Tax=Aquiflexum lacus TaxID=2483805 RepID=UPI001893084D|nr:TonB-dependent receptor [Aquiflexum lacus]
MRKFLLIKSILVLIFSAAFAQDRIVSGTVISTEDGFPMPGVTVMVKGTMIGTATDLDGNYSLSVPESNNILVFRFVGSEFQEALVDNRSSINVSLKPDSKSLEEFVVTGYSIQPKREITGAVSSVKGELIENLPMQSFDRALQGRATGVHVSSANGLPGGAVNIRIRGTGSINAGNEPLYVVDGVQINSRDDATFTQSNPLAFLNTNDIESIEILKDAASAAIYGSQAANGVVIITTKKGKQGKAQFSFNSFIGTSQPLKYLDVYNSQEWYQLRKEAWSNTGSPIAAANALNNMGILPSNWQSLSPEQLDAVAAELSTYDWQRQMIGSGSLQNHELAISGGDDKTLFRISGSYNYQESTFKPVDFERGTLSIALSHQANPRLRIENSLNISTFGQNIPFATSGSFLGNPAFSSSLILPHNAIYNEDGSFNTNIAGVLNQNIAMVNAYNSGSQRTNTMVGNLGANYQILENLTFRSMVGLDYRMVQGEQFRDPRTPDGIGINGRASVQSNWNVNFITTQTLNWFKTFAFEHNVSVLGGFEYRSETNEGLSGSAIGFPSFEFRTIQSGASPETISGFWSGYRRIGSFASVNYDFRKKYMLTLTGRYDGSSRFGMDTQYGFFPSVRVGWYIKEESFLRDSEVVSELKIRASYGRTGNDQIGNFSARGLYGAAGNYSGAGGIRPVGLENRNLSWEINQSANFGLDFGLMSNRLIGSVDLFHRKSKDLLLDLPVIASNGFNSVTTNIGELINRGIEFELTSINVDRGSFKWSTSFNYTYIENEITKLHGGSTFLPSDPSIAVGQSLGTHFTQQYAGVNPATGRSMWYDSNGDITYQPVAEDRVYLGNSLPSHYGGLQNAFYFKGFEAIVFFNYEYGRIIEDGQYNFLRENGARLTTNALREVADRRWTTPGQITDIPRPYAGGPEVRSVNMNTGSAVLLKADYIRLKQITLAYNFKPELIRGLGLSTVRIFAQGINLWTYTDFPGYDPEFLGAATGIIPQTKNYTIGIQAGF